MCAINTHTYIHNTHTYYIEFRYVRSESEKIWCMMRRAVVAPKPRRALNLTLYCVIKNN